MITGIYVRKSNDQTGVADDAKSVTRQIDHARQYAIRKGWVVAEEHVYVDDGICGAEFANRPGFVRLMNALKPRAPFHALVMSEVSRLGREQIETAYVLKQLSVAGVRCFSYLEDHELLVESATDKFMLGAVTFAAELEREKARQRVYDTMTRKARQGHVCGGGCFGYDNVTITAPNGTRSHVERRINEAEAAVVRRIFTLSAKGVGFTRIAKLLNAERVVCPRPDAPVAGWSPSTVNALLHRPIYRGELIWNRTQQRNQWGQEAKIRRPESDWIRQPAPALRIVSDEVWRAAHSRMSSVRAHLVKVSGGRSGAPRTRDIDSRYLLPGFARCAVCGHGLCVMQRRQGRQPVFVYGCLSHHKRGATVCGNGLVLPIDRVDTAVLSKLGTDVLRPGVVRAWMDGVVKAMRPQTRARDVSRVRVELQGLDREVARLTEAIATGGQLAPLLDALKVRQARREVLTDTLTAHTTVDGRPVDQSTIEAQVQDHLANWRALLMTKEVADGRQLLREMLVGPLKFTPDARTYRFEGDAAMGRLLAGMAGVATLRDSPPGDSQ